MLDVYLDSDHSLPKYTVWRSWSKLKLFSSRMVFGNLSCAAGGTQGLCSRHQCQLPSPQLSMDSVGTFQISCPSVHLAHFPILKLLLPSRFISHGQWSCPGIPPLTHAVSHHLDRRIWVLNKGTASRVVVALIIAVRGTSIYITLHHHDRLALNYLF